MRKNFTTSLTVIVAVIAILINAATAGANTITTSDISGVSRLKISGNVEVCIIQSYDLENLGIYNSESSSSAIISFEKNELNISTSNKEKLRVVLTVIDLSSIEINGNAVLHTLNTLNMRDLAIDLNDFSIADLDLDIKNLNIHTKNAASLKLSGSSKNQIVNISGVSKVDATEFKLTDSYLLTGRAKLYVSDNGERTTIQNRNSRKG